MDKEWYRETNRNRKRDEGMNNKGKNIYTNPITRTTKD